MVSRAARAERLRQREAVVSDRLDQLLKVKFAVLLERTTDEILVDVSGKSTQMASRLDPRCDEAQRLGHKGDEQPAAVKQHPPWEA